MNEKNRRLDPLLALGLVLLIMASVGFWLSGRLHLAEIMPIDAMLGVTYGLCFGTLLLGIRRQASSRLSC